MRLAALEETLGAGCALEVLGTLDGQRSAEGVLRWASGALLRHRGGVAVRRRCIPRDG
ncbi:hypothetical protein NKG05_09000 [Oerskovia sp. M15]